MTIKLIKSFLWHDFMHSHNDVVIFLLTQCCSNPVAMSLGGELPSDGCRSLRIR